jgi:hypothetical protein
MLFVKSGSRDKTHFEKYKLCNIATSAIPPLLKFSTTLNPMAGAAESSSLAE